MKLESFNNNLYIPRNVEGEPNRELLDITRAMEETLQQNESFVGLASFGSWMSGYSNEKSDIDLYVLYDSVHQSRVAFESFLNTVEKELEAARGRRIHCKAFDVNPDLVIADIPRDVDGCNPYVHRIQAMTRIVTGKKIDHYRGELAQKLHRLTPAEQQAVSNDTFRSLSNSDAESFGKRKKRMFDFSEEELLEVLKNRRDMWVHRIEKIWGIKPDQKVIDRYDPAYTIMMRPDYLDEDEEDEAPQMRPGEVV